VQGKYGVVFAVQLQVFWVLRVSRCARYERSEVGGTRFCESRSLIPLHRVDWEQWRGHGL